MSTKSECLSLNVIHVHSVLFWSGQSHLLCISLSLCMRVRVRVYVFANVFTSLFTFRVYCALTLW